MRNLLDGLTKSAMKTLVLLLALGIGTVLLASPVVTNVDVEAAQSKSIKKKKKPVQLSPPQKSRQHKKPRTNFRATAPREPNGAGISDFCAYTLEIYGRMGVGCNKYGRDFMTWD
jgi:hypothetical protein